MTLPDTHHPPQPEPLARRFLTWGSYPVVLIACLATALVAIQRGLSGLQLTVLVTGLSIGVAILVTLLEWVHPNTEQWRPDRSTVKADLLHLFFSQMVPGELANSLVRSALLGLAAWAPISLRWDLWPDRWPLLAQLILAAVISEFPHYWWHRLTHRSELLWRVHATHHSSPKLYWLAGARFHPFDNFVAFTLHLGTLLLLGCSTEVLVLFTVFLNVNGPFQHSNIRLRHGLLNYFISTAEVHRWHHSRDMKEGNSNFGGYLILWDLVFGTFYLPRDRQLAPGNLGLIGMPGFPSTFSGQVLAPFRWKKLEEGSTPPEEDEK
jgi:sterol desaturase/sphingolipid hydroxylase (fatty acid hydroxylase superfamily)